jgi:hypothetical protein
MLNIWHPIPLDGRFFVFPFHFQSIFTFLIKSLALMILASLGNWERCRTLVGEAAGAEKVDAILSLVQ